MTRQDAIEQAVRLSPFAMHVLRKLKIMKLSQNLREQMIRQIANSHLGSIRENFRSIAEAGVIDAA